MNLIYLPYFTVFHQLWQTVFEDTFSEYHRLSSLLAAEHDLSAALSVWKDYLRHVQV